jgi:hypothetical protein
VEKTAVFERAAVTTRRRVADACIYAPTYHDGFFRFHFQDLLANKNGELRFFMNVKLMKQLESGKAAS